MTMMSKYGIQHFPVEHNQLSPEVVDIGVLPVFSVDRLHNQQQKRK
jgi:hypothetical protein